MERNVPSVVSAVKSGASSPSCRATGAVVFFVMSYLLLAWAHREPADGDSRWAVPERLTIGRRRQPDTVDRASECARAPSAKSTISATDIARPRRDAGVERSAPSRRRQVSSSCRRARPLRAKPPIPVRSRTPDAAPSSVATSSPSAVGGTDAGQAFEDLGQARLVAQLVPERERVAEQLGCALVVTALGGDRCQVLVRRRRAATVADRLQLDQRLVVDPHGAAQISRTRGRCRRASSGRGRSRPDRRGPARSSRAR